MAFGPDQIIQAIGIQQNPDHFTPSQEQRDLVSKVYNDFVYDNSIKNQGWQVLNNRSLSQFWADSNTDYNVIVEQDTNNPVVQYSSGITRDKANVFIQKLTMEMQYPSVTAFNEAQEIDETVSYIGKPLLRWQFTNDGRPSESGRSKNFRYTHKQVVEGTVHILDNVGANGRLTSSEIPNETVFIPNFYQFDVQLQGHFLEVNQWASYAEVEAEFGDLPNFKYVQPGSLGWLNQTFAFKEQYKALVYEDQITKIRMWYPVREQELQRLKKIGRLPKWVTQAKYFNVILNDVPMFQYDNLMPFYHGNLPVTKAVFENFSPAQFYWGNSMPNKASQDLHFLNGWKTLMRYKGKLGAIPGLLNFTGQHIENDVYVPGVTTDLPAGTDPKMIVPVPGISGGVTSSDIELMNDTTGDIDRATLSPIAAGQGSGKGTQVKTAQLLNQNATEILEGLAQQLTFREEARAFPILKSTFQFLPRQDIKKISIPNETFDDGTSGTLEIIFQKIPAMNSDEKLQASHKIRALEQGAKKQGKGFKQTYVDPEYIQKLDLYCEASADKWLPQNSALRESKAELKWSTYSNPNNPPGLFNIKRAARELAKGFGDNPTEMVNDQTPSQPGMPPGPDGAPNGQQPLTEQNPLRRMQGQSQRQPSLIS